MSIVSNPVTGVVLGQPISPSFGQQSAGSPVAAGNPVAVPAGMTMMEAISRGILPRNMNVSAVNGVSTGGQNPTPIDDLMSNGAGNQLNLGVATAGIAGNPATNGAINQQQFVDGTSGPAQLSNGPTPTGVEALTSCPVSGATLAGNLTLPGSFAG